MNKIILHTNHCPRCNLLKEKLDYAGIEYDENSDVKKMLEKGMTQAPVLEINGRLLNFADAVKFIQGFVEATKRLKEKGVDSNKHSN